MNKKGTIVSAIGAGLYASAFTLVFIRGESAILMSWVLFAFGICFTSFGKTLNVYGTGVIPKKELFKSIVFDALVFFSFMLVAGMYALGISNGHEPQEILPNLALPVLLIFAGMFFYRFQMTTFAIDDVLAKAKSGVKLKSAFTNTEKRRVSMVIRKVFHEGKTSKIEGVVHGTLKVKDSVNLYGKKKVKATIKKIVVNDQEVDHVTDTMATVILDTSGAEKYEVISSVQISRYPLENPKLRALLFEYGELRTDAQYIDAFIQELVHTTFIVPVVMENTSSVLQKTMKIGFMAVNRTVNNVEEKTFAVFTDVNALTNWKSLFVNGKEPDTIQITFQDAVQLMMKGHSGIVINAFGPKYVYLPQEMIDIITKQESYRKEFGVPGEKGLSFDKKQKLK